MLGGDLRAQLEESLKRLAHLPEAVEDAEVAKEVIHLISRIEREAGGAGDGAGGGAGGGRSSRETGGREGLALLKAQLEAAKGQLALKHERGAADGHPRRERKRQEGGRLWRHEDDDDAVSIRSDASG